MICSKTPSERGSRALAGLASWLVLAALGGAVAAGQEGDRRSEALEDLGYAEAIDGAAEAAPVPEIHIVVGRDGSIDITRIEPQVVRAPPGMTASMATGTRVSIEDAEFPQKLARILKHLSADSERVPLIEGEPTSPLVSAIPLRIEADETHAFRTVQRIMEICARREVMIWNIELVVQPRSGEERSFATPLPGGAAPERATDVAGSAAPGRATEIDMGAPPGRVEISIDVREAGRKVDPESGEDWSGEGAFHFEGRALAYVVTADGRAGEVPPVEEELEESGERPAPEFAISLRTQDAESLGLALDLAKQRYPNAGVVIDAKPGTVYGDVVGVLDLVVTRFSSISFVGAR